jgi:hypothetical protein
VWERGYLHYPPANVPRGDSLTPGNISHTSDAARAATTRILEILGLEVDPREERATQLLIMKRLKLLVEDTSPEAHDELQNLLNVLGLKED